jgi:hypothetical protein
MKTKKLTHFILVFVITISFNFCVEDGDFTIPQNLGAAESEQLQKILSDLNDPNGTIKAISVANLKTLFIEGKTTEISTDLVVKGYVSSSDRTGNFFKEFFIQDELENPKAAIKISLDLNDISNKFNFGREVYIKLNGLSIGETRVGNGIITVGVKNNNVINAIPMSKIDDHILRSSVSKTLIPLPVDLIDISSKNIGLYLQITNVQFPRNIKDLTYVNPEEKFDTKRIIESCETTGNIQLETSSFATFGFAPLPKQMFTINGVVSKTFNGSNIVLVLNDKNDILETGERCDPDFFECNGSVGSSSIIFSEDFENFGTFANEGWDLINVDNKKTTWSEGNFSNNSYAQITAFSSADGDENVWLISPEINLDNSTGEQLSLDMQTSFNNGEILTIWVANNYDGEDPTTATWQLLDVNIPLGSTSGFGNFENINPVNISCLDGNIHIGFLYKSTENITTTRYHIDNFKISAD